MDTQKFDLLSAVKLNLAKVQFQDRSQVQIAAKLRGLVTGFDGQLREIVWNNGSVTEVFEEALLPSTLCE